MRGEQLSPRTESPKKPRAESYVKRIKQVAGILAATYLIHAEGGRAVAGERPGKPTSAIEYVKTEEPHLTEAEKTDLTSDLRHIKEKFGAGYEEYLVKVHLEKKAQRNSVPAQPRIEGFEKISIDNRDLRRVWSEEFFPQGWIDGNIPSIKNVEEIRSNSGKRATGVSRQKDNAVELDASFLKQEIHDPKDLVFALNGSFTHESVHDNDWDNDTDLSLRQRIEFLSDVSRAFDAPGAFRGFNDCVNRIKSSDKREERRQKVSENWAMLGELYFNFPDEFERLTPVEKELIEKWIKRYDVLFDAQKVFDKKVSLLDQIEKKQVEATKGRRASQKD